MTGVTSNIGLSIIKSLHIIPHQLELYAGVRNLNDDTVKLAGYKVKLLKFDFMDAKTYNGALSD